MNNKINQGLRAFAGYTLLGVLAFAPMQAGAVNLIANGTFENPNQGVGEWGLYASIPGWTAETDLIEIGDAVNVYGVSGATGQVLELDANHNATVEQDLTLSGGSYLLTFGAAQRGTVPKGSPIDTCDFDVLWNNTVVASIRPGSTTMTDYTIDLIGINGTNTLAFEGTGTSDAYGALIDNVVVQDVPEPGAVSLLTGIGVVGAGFLRRKRGK